MSKKVNVILKNKDGTSITYTDIDTVKLPTDDEKGSALFLLEDNVTNGSATTEEINQFLHQPDAPFGIDFEKKSIDGVSLNIMNVYLPFEEGSLATINDLCVDLSEDSSLPESGSNIVKEYLRIRDVFKYVDNFYEKRKVEEKHGKFDSLAAVGTINASAYGGKLASPVWRTNILSMMSGSSGPMHLTLNKTNLPAPVTVKQSMDINQSVLNEIMSLMVMSDSGDSTEAEMCLNMPFGTLVSEIDGSSFLNIESFFSKTNKGEGYFNNSDGIPLLAGMGSMLAAMSNLVEIEDNDCFMSKGIKFKKEIDETKLRNFILSHGGFDNETGTWSSKWFENSYGCIVSQNPEDPDALLLMFGDWPLNAPIITAYVTSNTSSGGVDYPKGWSEVLISPDTPIITPIDETMYATMIPRTVLATNSGVGSELPSFSEMLGLTPENEEFFDLIFEPGWRDNQINLVPVPLVQFYNGTKEDVVSKKSATETTKQMYSQFSNYFSNEPGIPEIYDDTILWKWPTNLPVSTLSSATTTSAIDNYLSGVASFFSSVSNIPFADFYSKFFVSERNSADSPFFTKEFLGTDIKYTVSLDNLTLQGLNKNGNFIFLKPIEISDFSFSTGGFVNLLINLYKDLSVEVNQSPIYSDKINTLKGIVGQVITQSTVSSYGTLAQYSYPCLGENANEFFKDLSLYSHHPGLYNGSYKNSLVLNPELNIDFTQYPLNNDASLFESDNTFNLMIFGSGSAVAPQGGVAVTDSASNTCLVYSPANQTFTLGDLSVSTPKGWCLIDMVSTSILLNNINNTRVVLYGSSLSSLMAIQSLFGDAVDARVLTKTPAFKILYFPQ